MVTRTTSRQIEQATSKAAKITMQLSRIMANLGEPLPNRRNVLMGTCNSILLYGSEIWSTTLETQTRAKKSLAIQRTAALRVTSAYRTVSAQAVIVIAGMIPIDSASYGKGKYVQRKEKRHEAIMKWKT